MGEDADNGSASSGGVGALHLQNLRRSFGAVRAVDDVSLDIAPGEFVTLLGPSGSGKTTTLNLIAGFLRPDSGRVVLDARDLTRVRPHQREVGMVFQNYALFPHLTVAKNIGFPLSMRHAPRTEIRRRVQDVLDLVDLAGYESRYPRQLSGGQQQRVALARAIVFQPSVLLMDEPLGALDRKLRESLQTEIMRISRQVGITVVYVTHDQEEALVMSHRVAVFNEGRIEQVDQPNELYERPGSLFVASFVGRSNVLRGTLNLDGEPYVEYPDGLRTRVSAAACRRSDLRAGDRVAVVIRPERLWVRGVDDPLGIPESQVAGERTGRIRQVIYLGSERRLEIELPDRSTMHAYMMEGWSDQAPAGPEVKLAWSVDAVVVVPDDGGTG